MYSVFLRIDDVYRSFSDKRRNRGAEKNQESIKSEVQRGEYTLLLKYIEFSMRYTNNGQEIEELKKKRTEE